MLLDHIKTKPYGVSEEMWTAWQEWRTTYRDKLLTKREKFDPERHLPAAFKKALSHIDYTDMQYGVGDLEAIEDGIARLDDYGNVIYDYEKLLKRDGVVPTTKVVDMQAPDYIDKLMETGG